MYKIEYRNINPTSEWMDTKSGPFKTVVKAEKEINILRATNFNVEYRIVIMEKVDQEQDVPLIWGVFGALFTWIMLTSFHQAVECPDLSVFDLIKRVLKSFILDFLNCK